MPNQLNQKNTVCTDTPMKYTVPEVRDMILQYLLEHKTNTLYGNMKGFFGGNVLNKHMQWTREYCIEQQDAAGVELTDILLSMSKTQRLKLSHCGEG